MGVTEIAQKMGLSKGRVSQLAKKGMPLHSLEAANAWRLANTNPKAPIKTQEYANQMPAADGCFQKPRPGEQIIKLPNTPEISLQRAIEAEDAAHKMRESVEKQGMSIEDYRKANAVYISARANRVKAQKDFAEWEHQQKVTVYIDEAQEMANRTIMAARGMIDIMPKTLAPRLYNQPQKEIEQTLLEWCSRLIETMRGNIWPKQADS